MDYGATYLTPITTGRDNRGALIITGKSLLLLSRGYPTRQQSRGPQFPQVQRALVILRGGLTPALHWAHAFLCAISCPAGEGWLDRGNGAVW